MRTRITEYLPLSVLLLVICMAIPTAVCASETGIAAYYSNVFHGRKTASGERYNKNALTAAHNTYPFGTQLRVTNLDNNKNVIVKVNDRGPHTAGRIIDLSREAARQLGFIKQGLTKVTIEVIE
ncbi:MAG TPA: septal ring lytic transglycosylase RlpA family protein [Crenotrichaceae bacterium]|nr:septal ring lytic transglycosylase RlpA family protein [Crenotrichaceae bacterium]